MHRLEDAPRTTDPEKSTTVRVKPAERVGKESIKAWSKRRRGWNRRLARLLHRGFRSLASALSSLAPCAATRIAEKIFLTPHRHRTPRHEEEWLADAREFTVPYGSRHLRAWMWGERANASKRTALLVHGWAGRGSQLGAFAAPLLSEGFRVVTFDGPGHGRSPGKRSSLPEMAGAVAALLRDLGGADLIVAHSLGAASTTAALAGFPGLDSDLEVGALAFVAPPSDVSSFARRFSHLTGLSMPVVHEMRRRIERRFGIEWHELHASRLAPRIGRPLWLAHSRDDHEVPVEHGRELAQAWPGATLYETDGLGHRRILRDGATIRRLVAFAAEHGRRRPRSEGESGFVDDPSVEAGPTEPALRGYGRSPAFDAAVAGYDA